MPREINVLALAVDSRNGVDGMNKYEKSTNKAAKATGLLDAKIASLVAGFAALQTARTAFNSLVKFDSALVGVQKTTDLADDALERLGERFLLLSRTEMSAPIENILQVAETAGQLGITGTRNIEKFTKAFIQLQGASDIQGQEGATQLARLIGITTDDIQDVDKVASVIARLGNTYKATESEILNTALAVAQSTSTFGLSSGQALAFGTTMAELGMSAELAGSSIGRVFRAVDAAARKGGDSLQLLADMTGQTSEQFTQTFERDNVAAVMSFVQALDTVEERGVSTSEVMAALGLRGEELLKTIPTLAKQNLVLANTMSDQSDEYKEVNALAVEVARRNETLEAKLGKLNNTFNDVLISARGYRGELGSTIDTARNAITVFFGLSTGQEKVNQTSLALAGAARGATAALIAFGGLKLGQTLAGWASQYSSFIALQRQGTVTVDLSTGAYIRQQAAISRVKAASIGLGRTIAANPLGTLTFALSTAIGLWYAFGDAVTDAEHKMKAARDEVDRIGQSFEVANLRMEAAIERGDLTQQIRAIEDQKRLLEDFDITLRKLRDSGKEVADVLTQDVGRTMISGVATQVRSDDAVLTEIGEMIEKAGISIGGLTSVREELTSAAAAAGGGLATYTKTMEVGIDNLISSIEQRRKELLSSRKKLAESLLPPGTRGEAGKLNIPLSIDTTDRTPINIPDTSIDLRSQFDTLSESLRQNVALERELNSIYDRLNTSMTDQDAIVRKLADERTVLIEVQRAINSAQEEGKTLTASEIEEIRSLVRDTQRLTSARHSSIEAARESAESERELLLSQEQSRQRFSDMVNAVERQHQQLKMRQQGMTRVEIDLQNDLQIARQLASEAGLSNDSTRLQMMEQMLQRNAEIAEQIKTEVDTLEESYVNLGNTAVSQFERMAFEGQSVGDTMKGLMVDIQKILFRQALTSAIGGTGINSLFGGIQGGVGSLFGGLGKGLGSVFSADGNMFSSGGVVTSPRAVPLSVMGERGPEAIVPLRRGQDGKLGIQSSGQSVTVNINVNGARTNADEFRRSGRQVANEVKRQLRSTM